MMLYLLIGFPVFAALLALLIRRQLGSKILLMLTAVLHLTLTVSFWFKRPESVLGGWFAVEPLGLLFLTVTSLLYFAAALYSLGYMRRETEPRAGRTDAPFFALLLVFISTISLVTLAQQAEMLWVAIEATTLVTAPLIYFHRSKHSLEAAWKYLILCSVGIALALMGNFLLGIAAAGSSQKGELSMLLSDLIARAPSMNPVWLKTAFVFLFVGYGTKMGLAPMHTWLPDAHSEAPTPISALLSGTVLNSAFLGILRVFQICVAAGQGSFAKEMMLIFGLVSMGVAAVFVLNQRDYKRLLAYSSVEHMGVMSIGLGLSGTAVFGSLLHAVNHSLAKGMLFFVAGNMLHAYHSRSTHFVRGVCRFLPVTGILAFAGFFAISGSPPFGLFISELTILQGALQQQHYGVAVLYLAFLGVVFVGMAAAFLKMLLGHPQLHSHVPPAQAAQTPAVDLRPVQERFSALAPPILLGVLVLILGLYIPGFLNQVLHEAAVTMGGR